MDWKRRHKGANVRNGGRTYEILQSSSERKRTYRFNDLLLYIFIELKSLECTYINHLDLLPFDSRRTNQKNSINFASDDLNEDHVPGLPLAPKKSSNTAPPNFPQSQNPSHEIPQLQHNTTEHRNHGTGFPLRHCICPPLRRRMGPPYLRRHNAQRRPLCAVFER